MGASPSSRFAMTKCFHDSGRADSVMIKSLPCVRHSMLQASSRCRSKSGNPQPSIPPSSRSRGGVKKTLSAPAGTTFEEWRSIGGGAKDDRPLGRRALPSTS
jgi:hypothetical protein